ncbi:regulator of DNA class I crossover intermediates 1 isoform X2 [Petaurus breviceps papuanus]|uniref:regulator of DNA class I crossover intermediates 1 isoform X2 n=1 Tax=Petaurus breviceps papuanus TaxID=3040969 RepID=UPI0036DBF620
MNWVGGSRTRIMFKQKMRKQKEYFEKKKLKSKKILEDFSPSENASVSLDLVNLCMVNHISTKKGEPATMRKPTFVDLSRNTKIPIRRPNLGFSVPSHYKASNLCLDTKNSRRHQRIDIKKGSGSDELSGVMDSYITPENQLKKIENNNFLSFSTAWTSNTANNLKQDFTNSVMPNPWKFTCKEKPIEQGMTRGMISENPEKTQTDATVLPDEDL